MNEAEELYVKTKKKGLFNAIDTGNLNEMQQYALISDFVVDVFRFYEEENQEVLMEYIKAQDKIESKMKELNKELQKQFENYRTNAKEMYDEIKKL